MSLDKFINKSEIINFSGEVLANKWETTRTDQVELEQIITGPQNIGGPNFNNIRLNPEAHIYVKVSSTFE